MSIPKDILVADDSSNDFALLQAAFVEAGLRHNLHRVRDGADAIGYVRGDAPFSNRTTHPFPQLLILDIQMPNADALEVLHFLRETADSRIPTIILSGAVAPGVIERALKLGAIECFDKPDTLEELIGIVEMIDRLWLEN
jgi:CheY-like chemotaxis protein